MTQHSASPRARLALVLDIDGTLIDSSDCDTVIHKRPDVDAFLDDAFASCAAVAIWTHASSHWAKAVVNCLRDAHGEVRPWAFVWSDERGTWRPTWRDCTDDYYSSGSRIKALRKVWNGAARTAAGFTRERTIIIEDTPSNCSRNYGNAFIVPTFAHDDAAHDDALPRLSAYLHDLAQQAGRVGGVRHIEKRWWSEDGTAQLQGAAATGFDVRTCAQPRRCVCYQCLQLMDIDGGALGDAPSMDAAPRSSSNGSNIGSSSSGSGSGISSGGSSGSSSSASGSSGGSSPGGPILFLDVDGVLNTFPRAAADEVSTPEGAALSASRVRALAALVTKLDCRLVLSSTWRLTPPLRSSLERRLAAAGVDRSRLLGATPERSCRRYTDDAMAATRAEEIRGWLASHQDTDGVAWLAIDDLSLAEHLGADGVHAVLTKSSEGLSHRKIREVERCLLQQQCKAVPPRCIKRS